MLVIGIHKHKDKKESKYVLLTYKGSRIVHTLYPKTSKNNPKVVKGFKFVRGKISLYMKVIDNIVTIDIPYFDHQEKKRYSILILKQLNQRIEKIVILEFDNSENPFKSHILGTKLIEYKDLVNHQIEHQDINKFKLADLRNIEKEILEIDNMDSL